MPTPTGMIAGPGVRSLLGGGASAEDVQTAIVKRVPILDTWGGEYSLLGFYDRAAQRENLRILTRIFLSRNARGEAARGYVMTDPNGDFVDAEICDLPAESAAPLLARLLVGHASEVRMNRLRGAAAVEHKRSRPPEVLLLDLIGSGATFLTAGGGEDVRVLRMIEPLTGAVLDVVEHREGERAILASAVAR